jgi:hypothetical protein
VILVSIEKRTGKKEELRPAVLKKANESNRVLIRSRLEAEEGFDMKNIRTIYHNGSCGAISGPRPNCLER